MNASMLAVRGHFRSRFTAFLVLKYCFWEPGTGLVSAWLFRTVDNLAMWGLREVHLLADRGGPARAPTGRGMEDYFVDGPVIYQAALRA